MYSITGMTKDMKKVLCRTAENDENPCSIGPVSLGSKGAMYIRFDRIEFVNGKAEVKFYWKNQHIATTKVTAIMKEGDTFNLTGIAGISEFASARLDF